MEVLREVLQMLDERKAKLCLAKKLEQEAADLKSERHSLYFAIQEKIRHLAAGYYLVDGQLLELKRDHTTGLVDQVTRHKINSVEE